MFFLCLLSFEVRGAALDRKVFVTSAVESESRSRKDFDTEESESQKILTTPTPGRPFARRL